ncbi:toll/interleukin-1 receptor domain-containing protein [Paenibacillus sp. FSL L8-0696]|uniref:toll/interleukin-1 receptor domain-containing protein n=1 Tax=Paenibacillus sp. FSL L8-0696 TaxID=2954524 RepID=UPI00311935EA
MTRVFISHKKEDSYQATEIAHQLTRNNIESYLDVLDPHLTGTGDELTKHLRSKLDECTHLIALLSQVTQLSWWVPFEIGLATEKEYPISSYVTSTALRNIPDYLRKWPVLLDGLDLNKYIALLKQNKHIIINEATSMASFSKPSYAEAFHKRMKEELNQ